MSSRNLVLLILFVVFLGVIWWLLRASRRPQETNGLDQPMTAPDPYARPVAPLDRPEAVAGAPGAAMAAGAATPTPAAPAHDAPAPATSEPATPAAAAPAGDLADPGARHEVPESGSLEGAETETPAVEGTWGEPRVARDSEAVDGADAAWWQKEDPTESREIRDSADGSVEGGESTGIPWESTPDAVEVREPEAWATPVANEDRAILDQGDRAGSPSGEKEDIMREDEPMVVRDDDAPVVSEREVVTDGTVVSEDTVQENAMLRHDDLTDDASLRDDLSDGTTRRGDTLRDEAVARDEAAAREEDLVRDGTIQEDVVREDTIVDGVPTATSEAESVLVWDGETTEDASGEARHVPEEPAKQVVIDETPTPVEEIPTAEAETEKVALVWDGESSERDDAPAAAQAGASEQVATEPGDGATVWSSPSAEGDALGDDLPRSEPATLAAGAGVYGEEGHHDHDVWDGGFGVGSAAPNEDGCMPLGHPVKAVYAYGKVYQVPGSDWYDETVPDLWFTDEIAAQRAGFRRGDG